MPPQRSAWGRREIEYEEERRGKHDGTLRPKSGDTEPIRFFTCEEGYGSFVKAHKVTLGRSVLEGLEWKYADENVALVVEDYKTQRRMSWVLQLISLFLLSYK